MDTILDKALRVKTRLNETYAELSAVDFKASCVHLFRKKNEILRVMFGSDEREVDGFFRVYAVFSDAAKDRFHILVTSLREDDLSYPSITREVPAAHWYERELRDMFGIIPEDHPDDRRLLFHESFPPDSHPLRKDWQISGDELREWGEGRLQKVPYDFFTVTGEGVYEIPVGPVHAGIIEPGHFRFSAVGETIFFLEARLFYTHKGTEKLFERRSFEDGIRLAERVSGTSSFSHSAAYCMAVERMSGITLSNKAAAVRTLLLELERLYNHIGDTGNLCAGTGLPVGNARGACLKEMLNRLNEKLTGSRYLRGINRIGGVSRDLFDHSDLIRSTMAMIEREFSDLVISLTTTISHLERLEDTGRLAGEFIRKLGATGVTARASGVDDDIRRSHPHLLYDRLPFEPQTHDRGDVYARMMVRVKEAEHSMLLIRTLLDEQHDGPLEAERGRCQDYASGLGYVESPRGSVFYWVKSGRNGMPMRVKLRSSSYCNWPVVPYAVHGNIVPDFPLCNKSFNLSYSGCDM